MSTAVLYSRETSPASLIAFRMAASRERALNVPAYPAAETRTFVGPFLRFGGGTDPGSRHWRGSVLCLTRQPNAPAAGAPPPTAATADGVAVPGGADAARAGLPTGAVVPGNHEQFPPGSGAAVAAKGAAAPAPVLVLQDSGRGNGSAGRQELQAQPLDSCLGWTAWRFDIELPLLEWQRPVSYQVLAGKQARAHPPALPPSRLQRGGMAIAGRAPQGSSAHAECAKGGCAVLCSAHGCPFIRLSCLESVCRARLDANIHVLAARAGPADALG